MNWFAKKVFDKGGGKDLKNRCKTCDYFFKIFNFVKNRKIVSDAQSKPLDRRTEKNTGSSVTLVNKKLTFARYDKIGGAGTRAARFIRKLLSSVPKLGSRAQDNPDAGILCNISAFIKKIIEELKRKPSGRNTLPPAGASCRGSILIEFAICMPILIILLFYIHDLIKIKRMYSQTEFVAQQFANIIQNISQKRENKKITANDLKYAMTLAYQTVYPGKTMFGQGNGLPFVHVPHPIIYYVKGNQDGTATAVWGTALWTNDIVATRSPETIKTGTLTTSHDLSKIKNVGTNVSPSQIYPTLKIGPGEVKIIVEALIFFQLDFKDINGKSGYTSREIFGCRLVAPKIWKNGNYSQLDNYASRGAFFNSVVIFTPKPGLFDETPPQE